MTQGEYCASVQEVGGTYVWQRAHWPPLFCELSFLSKPAGRPYVDKGALQGKGMLDYVIRNSSQNAGHSCK